MNRSVRAAVLVCGVSGISWAAHCTTAPDPAVLRQYENYVAAAEKSAAGRFDSGELSWLPASASADEAAKLASGKLVRWNVSDPDLNQRIVPLNGTVIHWIGAIRIHGASLADLKSVLEDYHHYAAFYRPIVTSCEAVRHLGAPDDADEVTLGLHNTYRFASVFPQHYAFRIKARIERAAETRDASALRVHLGATEIRESDSGVPGRDDFLDRYHDHGIMWALNAYWRARPVISGGSAGLYLEFETITLARSVEAFACKIGFVPIPKTIVASAMDSLPAESVSIILEGTRAECERRALRAHGNLPGK